MKERCTESDHAGCWMLVAGRWGSSRVTSHEDSSRPRGLGCRRSRSKKEGGRKNRQETSRKENARRLEDKGADNQYENKIREIGSRSRSWRSAVAGGRWEIHSRAGGRWRTADRRAQLSFSTFFNELLQHPASSESIGSGYNSLAALIFLSFLRWAANTCSPTSRDPTWITRTQRFAWRVWSIVSVCHRSAPSARCLSLSHSLQ